MRIFKSRNPFRTGLVFRFWTLLRTRITKVTSLVKYPKTLPRVSGSFNLLQGSTVLEPSMDLSNLVNDLLLPRGFRHQRYR